MLKYPTKVNMLMVKYPPRLNILMVTYPKASNTLIPKPIPKDTQNNYKSTLKKGNDKWSKMEAKGHQKENNNDKISVPKTDLNNGNIL